MANRIGDLIVKQMKKGNRLSVYLDGPGMRIEVSDYNAETGRNKADNSVIPYEQLEGADAEEVIFGVLSEALKTIQ